MQLSAQFPITSYCLHLSIDSRTISLGHWIVGKTVDWSGDRMVISVSDDANTQVVGRESPKVG